jgi:hypothetical protein
VTEEELEYWGQYGRLVTERTQMLSPGGAGDLITLWNAFGALEERTRRES